MKKKASKVQISRRAAFQRVDRALNAEGERLRTTRENSRARFDLGEYFVVDIKINGVVHKDIDLESYGRELGVIKKWEEVRSE